MTLLVIIKQQISKVVIKVGIVALYSQTLASVIIILKFYENQAQIE